MMEPETFFGNVEAGISKNPVCHPFSVSGWAFDVDGHCFTSIVLICGNSRFKAQLGIPRADVRRDYSNYTDSGISGYAIEVDLSVPNGNYQAKLVATTRNGRLLILSKFDFVVDLMPLFVTLETPVGRTHHSGGVIFSGWCCHPQHRVLELSISLGGIHYVCKYGLERKDVADAYSAWTGSALSGFEVLISLSAGLYKLQFYALLDNGEIVSLPIEIPLTIRDPTIWVVMYRKLRSTNGFVRFVWSQGRASYSIRGRLPSFTELPKLVLKAVYKFRQRNMVIGSNPLPPRGFQLPEKQEPYKSWLRYNQWNVRRACELEARLSSLEHLPLISVVMPVYNPPLSYLEIAIETVKRQIYENWELCIADDCSTNSGVRDFLKMAAASDPRIKLIFREENGNISLATNSAAELASGEFIAFLDNDDELTPDAIGEVALYLAAHPDCDFLYSDDDKIDETGKRFAPQFKPDWSPELLLSYMYFSHLCVVRRSLFRDLGGFRVGFEGSQDYDFALRATEHARHVGHISLVLYHWRALPGSTAQSGNAKPESFGAGSRSLQEAVNRRGISAKIRQPPWAEKGGLGIFSLDFPDNGPSVTIIIPTKNSLDILKTCVESLEITTYLNFDVIIVDNESDDPETLRFLARCGHRILRIANPPGGFNYSFLNNRAIEECRSEYVLFLNNDTKVLNPSWLSQMVGYARIQGVGAVGARLLYPDGRIQHAGIVHGFYKGMAGPAHKLLPSSHNGYLCYTTVSRNYIAVTSACMLISRQLFIDIGGFDEIDFGVAYNDVDLCYRLVDKGLRCVYSADSELVHYEGYSRGYIDKPAEEAAFKRKNLHRVDQYYNPNLSLENEQFEIKPSATQLHIPLQPIRALMVAFNLNLEDAPYSQYELTKGLKRLGIIHPVVFCPEDGPMRALYEVAGIEVIVRPHPLRGVLDIDDYEASISAFAELLRALSVQVVYGNTLRTFYAIDAANLIDITSIWNPRESGPWQTYFSDFGDRIAKKALQCFAYPYRIVFVSDATRCVCEPLNSFGNFTTIHDGLEPQRIATARAAYPRISSRIELGIGDDELMVLSLGTICESKGQIDLVSALKRLESSESLRRLRFFIVGERKSPYNTKLNHALDQLPQEVRARVSIVEKTHKNALYLSAADIFVCSLRVESYPRDILQAMYYGLSIVKTSVFGIAEQLTNRISALFYLPGDTVQLADHIERLAEDASLRKKLASNAKLQLDQLTNFDKMLQQYAEVFVGAYYSLTPNDSHAEDRKNQKSGSKHPADYN